MGNLEAWEMPRALCHVFQAIPEQFLECGRVHCPASGGDVAVRGVLGL